MLLTPRRKRRRQIPNSHRLVRFAANSSRNLGNPGLDKETESGEADLEGQPLDPGLLDQKRGTPPNKGQTLDPLTEFDEYGTELYREARVWKVYVRETDKHDAELVKGWNDSTDVILIFAALFSAISAAFLIESSKALQVDQTEVSAQTLITISQTLRAMGNGTQSLDSPPNEPADFTPSRTAICVNALWYLSLSLSLATSFIAILAKDWCHSFMSGRTGHPHSQTCRRQQKWDMLERWKMPELLMVLPSMIHVALFLFAIGLCIFLLDKNTIVAIPVIVISSIAFGFYLWSSVAAITIDFFPYPTIISRLYRTEIGLFLGHLVFHNSYLVACFLGYIVMWLWIGPILILSWTFRLIARIGAPLDRWNDHITQSSLPWKLLTWPLYIFIRVWVWYPMDKCSQWFKAIVDYFGSVGRSFNAQFEKPYWGLLKCTNIQPKSVQSVNSHGPGQSQVTSLALSWLIKYCEVPQSVDIALQAIAGANKSFPRQPLEECNASLEILRRLASSSLYRSTKAEAALSLYSRALSVLRPSIPIECGENSRIVHSAVKENIEGMVWELESLTERNVAALITDAKFQPTPHNLGALRIGSTFASYTLQTLRNGSKTPNERLDSIINMLNQHLSDEFVLHESALLLLVNAAASIGLLSTNGASASLRGVCRSLIQKEHGSYSPQLKAALITCGTLQNQNVHLIQSISEVRTRGELTIRALIDWQSKDTEDLSVLWEVALIELMDDFGSVPEECSDAVQQQPKTATVYNSNVSIERLWVSDPSGRLGDSWAFSSMHGGTALPYLEAFHKLYSATQPRTMPPHVYVFVLENLLPIPEPSMVSVDLLTKRSIASGLWGAVTSKDVVQKFFAASQLWLLFSIRRTQATDASVDPEEGSLSLLTHRSVENREEGERSVAEAMMNAWNQSSGEVAEALGGYAYRLMECLYRSSANPTPQKILDALHDVPEELRGLSSMIGAQSAISDGHKVIEEEIVVGAGKGGSNVEGGAYERLDTVEGAHILIEMEEL